MLPGSQSLAPATSVVSVTESSYIWPDLSNHVGKCRTLAKQMALANFQTATLRRCSSTNMHISASEATHPTASSQTHPSPVSQATPG